MELQENLAYGTVASGYTQATMKLKEDPIYDTVMLVSSDTQATMDLKENPAYGTVASGCTQATMELKENPVCGTAVLVLGDAQAPCNMTMTNNDSDYEN